MGQVACAMLLKIENADLSHDPGACWVVKDEVVAVEFAAAAGLLHTAVGPNNYAIGDALLTGSTGDRWCVSRDRFDAKYRPEAGTAMGRAGNYRNIPISIRAKRIAKPFSIARSAGGDVLQGNAGDWLVQYEPSDHGIVACARFEAVYRVVDGA
jgi:PGDYG protein